MFSRNTSKFLKLDVTTDETSDEALVLNDEMSGWLLKKRRKRMQGILILGDYYIYIFIYNLYRKRVREN